MIAFGISSKASKEYWGLKFTAEEAGSTIAMTKGASAPDVSLLTSRDGTTWNEFIAGTTTITLANVGDKIYFRAKQDNNVFATSASNYNKFVMTGKIAASGNLNTLLKADGSVLDLTGRNYCYFSMFEGCTSLTQAPALPATTLANYCYTSMFRGCTSLTQAPELPATTLANNCYASIFYDCSALTQAPALPATTLASSCYYAMFRGCKSLTQAPVLPATTLAEQCYTSMFQKCISLTKAPLLPATTLAYGCYYSMFKGCTKLNNINVNFSAWNPTNATTGWVNGVSSSGTFTCPDGLPDTPRDESHIPSGWTVVRK